MLAHFLNHFLDYLSKGGTNLINFRLWQGKKIDNFRYGQSGR